MGKWIWYPSDYELYHSMRLHCRREENGIPYPCMWHLQRPEVSCLFTRTAFFPEPETVVIRSRGKGFLRLDGRRAGGLNEPIAVGAGTHSFEIEVYCEETFPSILIETGAAQTGEEWTVSRFDSVFLPAGCDPALPSPRDDPAVFPFLYEPLTPAKTEETEGGVLYDYGTETFGTVTLHRGAEMGKLLLVCGESREEALDPEYAIVVDTIPAGGGEISLPARAFRYLFVKGENGTPALSASLEYLPFDNRFSFVCDDEKLPTILSVIERTFRLCSREFYLDGIKRDRWVWSGDAYQSFMVNRVFCFDEAIVRRTIRALLGRAPYLQHINTINDYSVYMILGVWEHWFATGDLRFVRSVWRELKALYAFICARLDPGTGYVVQRPGDWIFIDWSDIDKDGPLCAEQILLWRSHLVMASLSALMGEEPEDASRAETLRARILRDFWDEEKGAFIDTYASGRRNVTRHANIFAILYDFVGEQTQARITDTVLLGTIAKPITTPYFKFFELTALAKRGRIEEVQDYIDAYWGGMIDLGATTVWEQFDPNEKGTEHYAMYDKKYGRSLCHAWGSGPVALLGNYVAGVRPTGEAFSSFEVAPKPGRYRFFDAAVPVKGGTVRVRFEEGRVTASATVPGGVLKFAGKEIPIPENGEAVLAE